MTTPSLADLRRLYYGGGSDAEYQFLLDAEAAGITALTALEASETAALHKITEQRLNPAAPSIDLAGIAQDFRVLKGFASLRGDTAAAFVGLLLNLNNDAVDANYSRQYLQASAANATAQESIGAANSRQAGLIAAGTAPAGLFTQVEFTIVDYAEADKIKQVEISTGAYGLATATALRRHTTIVRNSLQAIDRVTLSVGAGNLLADSVLALYGADSPFG